MYSANAGYYLAKTEFLQIATSSLNEWTKHHSIHIPDERWQQFMEQFGRSEDLLFAGFSPDRFASDAAMVEINGTKRNGAFNPGTFGAPVGCDPALFLGRHVSEVILPMLEERATFFAKRISEGGVATREASLVLLFLLL